MDSISLRKMLGLASAEWYGRYQAAADTAAASASLYAYALESVLRLVEERHGRQAADELAAAATEMLDPAAWNDWMADVAADIRSSRAATWLDAVGPFNPRGLAWANAVMEGGDEDQARGAMPAAAEDPDGRDAHNDGTGGR